MVTAGDSCWESYPVREKMERRNNVARQQAIFKPFETETRQEQLLKQQQQWQQQQQSTLYQGEDCWESYPRMDRKTKQRWKTASYSTSYSNAKLGKKSCSKNNNNSGGSSPSTTEKTPSPTTTEKTTDRNHLRGKVGRQNNVAKRQENETRQEELFKRQQRQRQKQQHINNVSTQYQQQQRHQMNE